MTQGEWQAVMGDNPSYFRELGPEVPVESVDFRDVQTFLARVNATQRPKHPVQWPKSALRSLLTRPTSTHSTTKILPA